MKKRIIQDDIVQDIIYKYEVLRESRHKISLEYKMSDNLIIRILKDNNIKIRSLQEQRISRYKINENFFNPDLHFLKFYFFRFFNLIIKQ